MTALTGPTIFHGSLYQSINIIDIRLEYLISGTNQDQVKLYSISSSALANSPYYPLSVTKWVHTVQSSICSQNYAHTYNQLHNVMWKWELPYM